MSRKHNVKHPERGRSRYPRRLKKRGFSKSPELEPLDVLRTRQEKREEQTGYPWWSPRAEAMQEAAKLAEGPEAELLRAIFEDIEVALPSA